MSGFPYQTMTPKQKSDHMRRIHAMNIRGLYMNTKYTIQQLAARYSFSVDAVKLIVSKLKLPDRAPRRTRLTDVELSKCAGYGVEFFRSAYSETNNILKCHRLTA